MPGLLPTCATARPGAPKALATATAISFLFIENVSSSIDSRAAAPRAARINPYSRLLQFCQSSPSSSTRSVNFYRQRVDRCCFFATVGDLKKSALTSHSYEQPLHLHSRVCCAQKSLPDQENMNSGASQSRDLFGNENPAFGDHDPRRGNMRQQAKRCVERSLETSQVAVVDADERSGELEGEVELGAVVHFGEHRHAERDRESFQLAHPRRRERGHDEQNAVGA